MIVNLFYVDQKTRDLAPREFGKTPEELEEDVVTLADWVKTQPHFPEVMNNALIRNFLLLNKMSIEKTKKKIDMYYTVRSVVPYMYKNTNPNAENMISFMKKGIFCPYPVLQNNHRCCFVKQQVPFNFDCVEVLMQMFNVLEIRLHEDCLMPEILIFDLKHTSFDNVKSLTPKMIKDTLFIYSVYSTRVKDVYLLNSPLWISWIVKILKSVLKPKLFNRVHVHENEDVIKQIFTEEDCPQDYGGNGYSLVELNKIMIKKLFEYKNRFDKLQEMQVDESLRPTKLDNDDILGYYGNFKQLVID